MDSVKRTFLTLLTVLTTSLASSLEYSVHEQEFVNASVYLSAANCRYAKNNYVKKMQTFIYLFSTTSQIPGCFQARAYPICHGAKRGCTLDRSPAHCSVNTPCHYLLHLIIRY